MPLLQTNLEGDYLPQCFRCTSDKPGSRQSRPQSSSLLRMTDDGNSSVQSDFRSSADWLLKHNSITTGSEDDTGVNKDG